MYIHVCVCVCVYIYIERYKNLYFLHTLYLLSLSASVCRDCKSSCRSEGFLSFFTFLWRATTWSGIRIDPTLFAQPNKLLVESLIYSKRIWAETNGHSSTGGRNLQGHTIIYRDTQSFTGTHNHLQGHTIIYRGIQSFTSNSNILFCPQIVGRRHIE